MSKGKEDGTEQIIFSYLKNQNRPYSVNDLVTNLHNEHGKAQVQKSIDQLVSNGKVKEKTYGKQKVYWIDQNQFSAQDPSMLSTLDRKIAELTREIQADEEAVKKSDNELKILTSSLSTEEAKKQLAELLEDNGKLEQKIADLSQNRVKVSADDFKKVKQSMTKTVTEWRKRKRMCVDIIDAILESYPKSKKALIEEVGIEADEDVGAKIPS